MGEYSGGKLRSADNERVLNQIDQRRTNFAEVAYLDLELATKIVKEIESQRSPASRIAHKVRVSVRFMMLSLARSIRQRLQKKESY